jgi:putative alpha-1,2-mannosidase
MFTFSGKPWLSQKWMRTICNEFYGTEGVQGYGHGQDEDQRQLGAWHVMAAMGLSDVKGLTASEPSLQIVSHLFDKMTVRLGRDYFPGKEFVIKTNGNSIDNIYICIQSKAQWGGTSLPAIAMGFSCRWRSA